MRRSRARCLSCVSQVLLLCVTLGLAGCHQSRVCSYSGSAGADGITRVALVVGAHTKEGAALPALGDVATEIGQTKRLLAEHGFPAENICELTAERATLDNFRQALRELSSVRGRVTRFLYVWA